MALEKKGKYYRYEFTWRGKRIRRSTGLTDPVQARRAENRHRELLATLGPDMLKRLEEQARVPALVLPTLEEYGPKFPAFSELFPRRFWRRIPVPKQFRTQASQGADEALSETIPAERRPGRLDRQKDSRFHPCEGQESRG
jgi:hypothetical protein